MKFTLLTAILGTTLLLTACNQSDTTQNQSSDSKSAPNTANEVVLHTMTGEVNIPKNPNPIAVFDMTALQNLAALGVFVQGVPDVKADRVAMLNLKAQNSPDGTVVGTVFEPNLEALDTLKPQAVFVGSRMAPKLDSLNKVAKTYNLTIDTNDVYQATKQQLTDFGALFDKQEQADKLIKELDDTITQVKTATKNKGNGLAILINGDKMSAYGKNSRYGFLHTTFGIPMADEHIQEARHGQPISFEYLQKTDPDWLFVLDRTAAIGEEGKSAQAVLDNPLIHNTKAWKNKQIVYLSPDSYLAFGGYYQWQKDAKIILDAFTQAANNKTDTQNNDKPSDNHAQHNHESPVK